MNQHASIFWGNHEGVARIVDEHGDDGSAFAAIPLTFSNPLELTNEYIYFTTQHLISDIEFSISFQGKALPKTGKIQQGTYLVSSPDGNRLSYRPGPTDKSGRRRLVDEDQSSVSHSSRSSATQNRFRNEVRARDAALCVVTGKGDIFGERTEACHIVPKSRGSKLVARITGDETFTIDDVRNGLCMMRNLHTSFDRFQWGIFVDDDSYQIHSFIAESCKDDGHGKSLVRRHGDYWKRYQPERRLLQWHYQQCVLARLAIETDRDDMQYESQSWST